MSHWPPVLTIFVGEMPLKWARNSMVNKGLLKKDSPRGIWEISDNGENYLRQNG